jgi:uncharacterized protein YjhX (UPF0386 family)
MNISKAEQRVLHVLAQGGMIRHRRCENGHIVEALCFTRDGFVLAGTALSLFNRLRRRSFIALARRRAISHHAGRASRGARAARQSLIKGERGIASPRSFGRGHVARLHNI